MLKTSFSVILVSSLFILLEGKSNCLATISQRTIDRLGVKKSDHSGLDYSTNRGVHGTRKIYRYLLNDCTYSNSSLFKCSTSKQ